MGAEYFNEPEVKASANLATFPARRDILPKMIASVYDQFDIVRVFLNQWEGLPIPECLKNKCKIQYYQEDGMNLTDNGKFYFIPEKGYSPEIYFTLDDDLIYPKDYVKVTLENLNKHPGSIISYHGRKLKGTGLRYYRDHKAYRCLGAVHEDTPVDVPGSGVAAFDTRYFCPDNIWNSPNLLMSDLILAQAAAEERIPVWCCKHEQGWIGYLNPVNTIWDNHSGKHTPVQNKIADEIFKLRNSTL